MSFFHLLPHIDNPSFLGPFHGAIAVPSRVVVVVLHIDAQVAHDSTAGDTWWMGVRWLAVVNGPNIFQMLLVWSSICRTQHQQIFAQIFAQDSLDRFSAYAHSVHYQLHIDGIILQYNICNTTAVFFADSFKVQMDIQMGLSCLSKTGLGPASDCGIWWHIFTVNNSHLAVAECSVSKRL